MTGQDTRKLEFYRRHLLNHRWILTREYWRERDASRQVEEEDTEELRDLLLSLGEIERDRLIRIQEALARIERGDYGLCSQCGVHIPESRLDAVPWADLCIVCQGRVEEGSPVFTPPGRGPVRISGAGARSAT